MIILRTDKSLSNHVKNLLDFSYVPKLNVKFSNLFQVFPSNNKLYDCFSIFYNFKIISENIFNLIKVLIEDFLSN